MELYPPLPLYAQAVKFSLLRSNRNSESLYIVIQILFSAFHAHIPTVLRLRSWDFRDADSEVACQ